MDDSHTGHFNLGYSFCLVGACSERMFATKHRTTAGYPRPFASIYCEPSRTPPSGKKTAGPFLQRLLGYGRALWDYPARILNIVKPARITASRLKGYRSNPRCRLRRTDTTRQHILGDADEVDRRPVRQAQQSVAARRHCTVERGLSRVSTIAAQQHDVR